MIRFQHTVEHGVVLDGPGPIEWIETSVNEPGMMQVVLDSLRLGPVDEGDAVPMHCPPRCSKKQSARHILVSPFAALVRISKSNRISYGPRLAADNDVSEGTVRSWVHEARDTGCSISREAAETAQKSRFSRILAALPLRSRR